jgi:hypothetical protein
MVAGNGTIYYLFHYI